MTGLDVLGQHAHAAHEVLGVRGERLAHHLRIGQHEVRRRDRVADLFHVELGLVARVLVEVRVLHQPLAPLRGEQIGLLHEIVELVRRPFGIGEALVARRRRGHRPDRFAGEAFRRRDPEFEIGLAEAGLDLDRALRIGEPVFGDVAERLDHVGDLVGRLDLDLADLARLEIGGERLAAFLDHAGDVARELLDVDRGRCRGRRRQPGRRRCRQLVLGRSLLHAFPARGSFFFQDYGPWIGHFNDINLFEATFLDTVSLCIAV